MDPERAMTSPGTPDLDTRVEQLRALADPRAIRLMTFIGARPGHAAETATLAARTGETEHDFEQLLAEMVQVGLLDHRDDSVTITDVAWLRYRRLFLEKVSMRSAGADEGWDGYPAAIKRLAGQLSLRFERTFNAETINQYVKDSYDDLHSRSVTGNFLVLLTSRLVHDRLGKIAASRGLRLRRVPRVLFVCTHNSGRSQLATALLRHRASGRVEVSSAGLDVHESVNSHVYTVLQEMGVPPLVDPPEPIDRTAVRAADIVITMGCGDVCPIVPGPRYLDWPMQDPALGGLAGYRQAMRVVDQNIAGLLNDLI